MQIFFALLSSFTIKFDGYEDSSNLDVLLTVMLFLPLALSVYLETPLADLLNTKRRAKLYVFIAHYLPHRPKLTSTDFYPNCTSISTSSINFVHDIAETSAAGYEETALPPRPSQAYSACLTSAEGFVEDEVAGNCSKPSAAYIRHQASRMERARRGAGALGFGERTGNEPAHEGVEELDDESSEIAKINRQIAILSAKRSDIALELGQESAANVAAFPMSDDSEE